MEPTPSSRSVHILREDVANRIAAGEVIDRPFSIVRELLDNAIDAGATKIDVDVEGGGLDRVRVVDNGQGMSREDLELCWLPHATSKIEELEDLTRVRSLGFRGEALSSVALCARLELESRSGQSAHRLVVENGKLVGIQPASLARGTAAEVTRLFHAMPARKRFLKSPGAESALCAGTFLDKALPYPGTRFRFSSNGELKRLLLPGTAAERVAQAYSDADPRLMGTLEHQDRGFAVRLVLLPPDVARRDRRLIQTFVNGRRIQEFALIQAVEHGFAGTIPGGLHPVAFVFLSVDPELVDFNVHPAKREARFRDLASIHRRIVTMVRSWVPSYAIRAPRSSGVSSGSTAAPGVASGSLGLESRGTLTQEPPRLGPGMARPLRGAEGAPAADVGREVAPEAVHYHGQLFGLFLIVERGDVLYLVDQHAAHERLIYDSLLAQAPEMEELLFPIAFSAPAEQAEYVERHTLELEGAGVRVRRSGASTFEIVALAGALQKMPEDELVRLVCGDSEGGENGAARRALADPVAHDVRAAAACAAAVRDGQPLGEAEATELATRALGLREARCPHGRPVWHELSRRDLLRLVRRTT